jgi:hypothetical protein
LRFGDSSYAYRYINGYVGVNIELPKEVQQYGLVVLLLPILPERALSVMRLLEAKGRIGNWIANDPVTHIAHANGFLKVPFSAWDGRYCLQ